MVHRPSSSRCTAACWRETVGKESTMSQEAARPMMFSQWFSGSFAPLGRLKKPQCSSSVRPRSSEAAQRQTMSAASTATSTCSASVSAAPSAPASGAAGIGALERASRKFVKSCWNDCSRVSKSVTIFRQIQGLGWNRVAERNRHRRGRAQTIRKVSYYSILYREIQNVMFMCGGCPACTSGRPLL